MSLNNLAEANLADVCRQVTDGTHDTPAAIPEGFPLIKAKEIVGGRIDFENCVRISEEEHLKVIARSKPEKGDTLFAHIGASLGEAAYVNTTRGFSIKNVALFKPNLQIIDGRYLFYLVTSPAFQSLAKNTRTGSAQPFLSLDLLRKHRIRYHKDTSEQRKIAAILSAYDDLIENNSRRIQLLETMAQALYREWFVNFRFPGHEQVKLVKSPLGMIPEGWEVKQLGDLVSDIIDYRGKTPKKLGDDWSSSGITALSALNVKQGRLVSLDKAKFVSPELYKKWMKSELMKGDILMTSEAPLGEIYYLTEQRQYCLSQRLFSIRADAKLIKPAILFSALSSPAGQKEIHGRATGTTVLGIRQSQLRLVPLIVPPDDLQKLAAPVLDNFFNQIETLQAKNTNLRQTRDLLLPKLISGEVDVSALDINTAALAG